MTTRARFETDRLLCWLGEVLRQRDSVDVDIVIVEKPLSGCSLQITVIDVPGLLAELPIHAPVRPAPVEPAGAG